MLMWTKSVEHETLADNCTKPAAVRCLDEREAAVDSTNMAAVDVVAIPLLSCETIELTSFVDLASALLAFGAIAACAFVVAKGCEDRTLWPGRLKQRYHTVSRLSMHGQDSFFLVLSFFVCFRKTD